MTSGYQRFDSGDVQRTSFEPQMPRSAPAPQSATQPNPPESGAGASNKPDVSEREEEFQAADSRRLDVACSPRAAHSRSETSGHVPGYQRSELREITIHRCEVCGHYEGESPQAGCCPKCGTASDSIPVKVKIDA